MLNNLHRLAMISKHVPVRLYLGHWEPIVPVSHGDDHAGAVDNEESDEPIVIVSDS